MTNPFNNRLWLDFIGLLQHRIAPSLSQIGSELKRYNDARPAEENKEAVDALRHLALGGAGIPSSERPDWEYRILGAPFEKLRCPKGDCRHEFLVKMSDLDAGAASWVWCPLCKNRVELHTEEP